MTGYHTYYRGSRGRGAGMERSQCTHPHTYSDTLICIYVQLGIFLGATFPVWAEMNDDNAEWQGRSFRPTICGVYVYEVLSFSASSAALNPGNGDRNAGYFNQVLVALVFLPRPSPIPCPLASRMWLIRTHDGYECREKSKNKTPEKKEE